MSADVRFVPKADIRHMMASQTAKPRIDQAEAATAVSISLDSHAGTLVTLRSDRVACGRAKEPPPYS
jgi:hypothetical protein